MKEEKKNTVLPAELFETADIYGQTCNVSVGEGSIIILNQKMTALETIKAIEHLSNVTISMLISIRKACYQCNNCEEWCSLRDEHNEYLNLPKRIRKQLEIPDDVKIDPWRNEWGDLILSTYRDSSPSLRDVPDDLFELLKQTGICFSDLEDVLRGERIIYDGESYINEEDV